MVRKSLPSNVVVSVDRAREEARAERAERHEADVEFFQGREDLVLRLAAPQGIFALQGGDRLDGMGAADGSSASLRQAEMLHLAPAIRSFTVPATSSIGTFGSTRCW